MIVERLSEDATLLDVARRAVDIASDRQANDIVLLDISAIASFADFFVICHGDSVRQIKAIADAIAEGLADEGFQADHIEGTPESGWVLIDFGSVIVHVFGPDEREYYRLEKLWSEGALILRAL